jgi:xanthine dehydrogenase accessory factor
MTEPKNVKMTSIYQALANLEKSGQPGILCTIVSTQGSTPRREGSKMLVYPDGEFIGTVGGGEVEHRVLGEALEALGEGKPRMLEYSMIDPKRGDPGVCGGQLKIFIEPIMPGNILLIVGGGHVGKEVAHLGHWLGFRVVVFDDRPEFSNPEAVPDVDEFYPNFLLDWPPEVEIAPWTYVVLTTRNVDVDLSILPILLDNGPAYIGVIGSRRRWATTKAKLLEFGIPEKRIDLIHSPIGLDLKSETPREIALSIVAEIIMVQKRGTGISISSGMR